VFVNYVFEEIQTLCFVVVDIDDEKGTLSEQDFIGCLTVPLTRVITLGSEKSYDTRLSHKLPPELAAGFKIARPLNSTIRICAERIQSSQAKVQMTLCAQNLDKLDFNLFAAGSSDQYFEIHKARNDDIWVPIYRSEVLKKELNPVWPSFSLDISSLNNGNMKRTLKAVVWNWVKSDKSGLIGESKLNLAEIKTAFESSSPIPVINPKKKDTKKTYKN
jgi:hypothetical protein